jgi:serine/threonine protein kinase
LVYHVSYISSYNLVLKDSPVNKNADKDVTPTVEEVAINGGTGCYQAPELFKKGATFSWRADVYAGGIIFLELLTGRQPNTLYEYLWPSVLDLTLPPALLKCLYDSPFNEYSSCSLDENPEKRVSFEVLFVMLNSPEGKQIREMSTGNEFGFDELDADLREMLPSSRYPTFESQRMDMGKSSGNGLGKKSGKGGKSTNIYTQGESSRF